MNDLKLTFEIERKVNFRKLSTSCYEYFSAFNNL